MGINITAGRQLRRTHSSPHCYASSVRIEQKCQKKEREQFNFTTHSQKATWEHYQKPSLSWIVGEPKQAKINIVIFSSSESMGPKIDDQSHFQSFGGFRSSLSLNKAKALYVPLQFGWNCCCNTFVDICGWVPNCNGPTVSLVCFSVV